MAHSSFSLCHCRTPSIPLTVLITFVLQLSARLESLENSYVCQGMDGALFPTFDLLWSGVCDSACCL